MKSSISTVFLLLISLAAYSQKGIRPGYILQQNDTIRGFIKYREGKSSLTNCTFYKTESSEPQEYTPETLSGYGTAGRDFRTMKPDTAVQFIQVIVEGKASLYGRLGSFIVSKDSVMVEIVSVKKEKKVGGRTYAYEDKSFAQRINVMLGDCPDVVKPLAKMRLYSLSSNQRERVFKKMVMGYNACQGETSIVRQETPRSNRQWGILGGITFSDSYFKDFVGGKLDYKDYAKSTVGFFINYTNPRVSEKLQFRAELMWESYESSYVGALDHRDQSAEIRYSILKLPISVSYRFLPGKISPYVRAGAALSLLLNETYHAEYIYEDGTTRPAPTFDIGRSRVNFFGGVGGEWKFTQKKVLFIETRFTIA